LTDSNGREILERRRDHRDYYNLNLTEPQAANYFPFSALLGLRDQRLDLQLSLSADRAQGGTSLVEGQLEVLLHRRLLSDDGEGLNEPLNETSGMTYMPNQSPRRLGDGIIVRTKHLMALTRASLASRSYRESQEELFAPPLVAFFPGIMEQGGARRNNASKAHSKEAKDTQRGGLGEAELPRNVFLLSSEAIDNVTVLIRLAHKYAVSEDAQLSKPVNCSLDTVAALLNLDHVASVAEVTLTANQLLAGPFPVSPSLSSPPQKHHLFPSAFVSSLPRAKPRLKFKSNSAATPGKLFPPGVQEDDYAEIPLFEREALRVLVAGSKKGGGKGRELSSLPTVLLKPLQIRTFIYCL